MQIKRDWNVHVDKQQYLKAQGKTLDRLLARPGMPERLDFLLSEANRLVSPAACWDHFPIREVRHEHLVLNGNVRIGGGPVTQVVGGAEELLVGVCTVGPAIENRVVQLKEERDLLGAVILDEIGSWAVDLVRLEMCRLWSAEADARGWRSSASLSPGESAWSIDDQKVIFSLLDTEKISVGLGPTLLMDPLKSLSLIMGRGSRPMGVEGASNCDFCTMRERCRYREARLSA